MRKLILCPKNNDEIKRTYTIAEFKFSDFNKIDQKNIIESANELFYNVNNKAANTGKQRNSKTIENDAYSGMLAEFATLSYLQSCSNVTHAARPQARNLQNQIDITINCSSSSGSKSKSIEVRSSFARNGIQFALFKLNKLTKKPYFDIIGPYYQSNYKVSYEPLKDIYFRVLFQGTNYNVKERFINNNESFFIVGYQLAQVFIESGFEKVLTPGSAIKKEGEIKGKYFVLPIDRIIDLSENYLLID